MAESKIHPVPFSEAIRWARGRKVVLPDVYYGQMQGIARAQAFSVQGLASLDQLQGIIDSLTDAIEEGSTFREWKKQVEEGSVALELPEHRLENIWRTNTQGHYGRGRCEQQARHAETRPQLLYDAVNDSRTRPSHAAMDGFTAPRNAPIWKQWYPPAGYQCRCRVIALTEEQAKKYRLAFEKKMDNPEAETAFLEATVGGPDEGWDYHPCEGLQEGTQRAERKRQQEANRALAKALEERKAQEAVQRADDPDMWKALEGTQKGSNPGGMYEAPDGARYYVKFYADPKQARTEHASNAVHRLLGVETLESRILDMAGPGGGRKTAIASRWRDDLVDMSAADMIAAKDQLAKIYHASVLTKNWDVVGLNFDNLKMSPAGKVVIVDTGGSFKFRAQGGAKSFGKDIGEIRTLRDHGLNPQSAEVFDAIFKRDVFLEHAGAQSVKKLTQKALREKIDDAGFSIAEAEELTATLWGRRTALVDRYDLTRKYTPKGFGKKLKQFQTFGATKWETEIVTGGHVHSAAAQDEIQSTLMKKFEAQVEKQYGKKGVSVLRKTFREWSGSSSMDGSGAIKMWAESRFGVVTNYHRWEAGAEARIAAANAMEKFLAEKKITKETLFELLDMEYEWTQYCLRRIHGWDPVIIDRGMSSGAEVTANIIKGRRGRGAQFRGNSVSSMTTREEVAVSFSGSTDHVRLESRVEDTIKLWYQGHDYMHYGVREAEYLVIGRTMPAELIPSPFN